MLKQKLQYFGHLMQRTDSLEKDWCWERLKARGEGDNRGWDDWMASPTWWTWVWASSGRWWKARKSGVLQSMGSQSWTWLSNWIELQPISSPQRRTFFLFSFFLSFFLPTIQNICLMCQAPCKPCLAFDPDQIQWNYQIDSSCMCMNLYIETIGLWCKKVLILVLMLEICLLMLLFKKVLKNINQIVNI